MDEHRRLCELGWMLDDVVRKRRGAQARTRAYSADQAAAADPESRKRAQMLADKWAMKAGQLMEKEEALSREYDQMNKRLKRSWKESL